MLPLQVELHDGGGVVVGIERGVVKQIDAHLQLQGALEQVVLVIVVRVEGDGGKRQDVFLHAFLEIDRLVEIEMSRAEHLLAPGGEYDQGFVELPRHGGRVEIDVAEQVREPHADVRAQPFVDVAPFHPDGFDRLEVVFPPVVVADVAVEKRVGALQLEAGVRPQQGAFVLTQRLADVAVHAEIAGIVSQYRQASRHIEIHEGVRVHIEQPCGDVCAGVFAFAEIFLTDEGVVAGALVVFFVPEIQAGIDAGQVFVFRVLVYHEFGGHLHDVIAVVVGGLRAVDVGVAVILQVDALLPETAAVAFRADVQDRFGGVGVTGVIPPNHRFGGAYVVLHLGVYVEVADNVLRFVACQPDGDVFRLFRRVRDEIAVPDTAVFPDFPFVAVEEYGGCDAVALIGGEEGEVGDLALLVGIPSVAGNQVVAQSGIPEGGDVLHVPRVQQVFRFPLAASGEIPEPRERGGGIEVRDIPRLDEIGTQEVHRVEVLRGGAFDEDVRFVRGGEIAQIGVGDAFFEDVIEILNAVLQRVLGHFLCVYAIVHPRPGVSEMRHIRLLGCGIPGGTSRAVFIPDGAEFAVFALSQANKMDGG